MDIGHVDYVDELIYAEMKSISFRATQLSKDISFKWRFLVSLYALRTFALSGSVKFEVLGFIWSFYM